MKIVYQHDRVQRKTEKTSTQADLTEKNSKIRCAEILKRILAFLKKTISARFRFDARLTFSVREEEDF